MALGSCRSARRRPASGGGHGHLQPRRKTVYAIRLGLPSARDPLARDEKIWLRESGYIRLETGAAVALLDVAPVEPDYLPGHAEGLSKIPGGDTFRIVMLVDGANKAHLIAQARA